MARYQAEARRRPETPPVMNFSNVINKQLHEQGKIVAFSGKLGAGKDSSCRFLLSMAMVHGTGVAKMATVSDSGKLMVDFGNGKGLQEFNEDSRDRETQSFLYGNVWPFMRKFSCADALKEFLNNVLNVDAKLLWGSQEDKKGLTHLKWEDMPTFQAETAKPKNKSKSTDESETSLVLPPKTGFMSGREIMEYFGTEIVRKMYPRAWAKALANNILQYNSQYSLVNDIRFKDEVEEIQAIGGKIIRLTRVSEEAKNNTHVSNTELDNYDKFDAVIDNDNMSMEEAFSELVGILHQWGWFSVVSQ